MCFLIVFRALYLLDADLGARRGLAGKALDAYLFESDDAVFGCVNREVAAHKGARARSFGFAYLADENLAGFNGLATKALDAEALTG